MGDSRDIIRNISALAATVSSLVALPVAFLYTGPLHGVPVFALVAWFACACSHLAGGFWDIAFRRDVIWWRINKWTIVKIFGDF